VIEDVRDGAHGEARDGADALIDVGLGDDLRKWAELVEDGTMEQMYLLVTHGGAFAA
jgi:hypothetical protein